MVECVCIMYRNELSSRCESVKLDTRRACAVKLSVNDNFKLLIVCVYMPCDPQLVNKVNVEYEEVLNCVEGLIQSTKVTVLYCVVTGTRHLRGTMLSRNA